MYITFALLFYVVCLDCKDTDPSSCPSRVKELGGCGPEKKTEANVINRECRKSCGLCRGETDNCRF